MKRKPETEQDLIDALAELFEQGELGESIDEVDEELRAAGLDPAEVGSKLAKVADEAYRASPAYWRQRAEGERKAAQERLKLRSKTRTGVDRDELIRQIGEIVSRSPKLGEALRVQAHFRNFDVATDEDLADLLDELQFLESQGSEDE